MVDPETRRRILNTNEDESSEERFEPPPGTWDPDLPYGGKVMVARKKKADPLWLIGIQVAVGCFLVFLCYYSYFYFENVIFHVHNVYAHFGHAESQHHVSQHYLQGVGVEKNHELAMHWMEKASKKGHPEASYNLAVGHLKGSTKLRKGETVRIFKKPRRKWPKWLRKRSEIGKPS